MALPEFIEIVPLDKPIRAEITVPGSKSITNRALILAALAEGETTLEGALWSEDTEVMVESLRDLGFMVNLETDPNEPCNRTITVYGKGGVVPSGGTESQPLDLFVGNAGTAARFLAAFVCLGTGVYRLHGAPRMHDRPQAELFSALRQLGYHIESENNNEKLPAKITVAASSGVASRLGLQGGRPAGAAAGCSVRIGQSSQFASALMLCAQAGNWNVRIEGENAEESPYVVMTSELIKVFPKQGGTFRIEPDASSGSYFLAAELLVPRVYSEGLEYSLHWKMDVETTLFSKVSVAHWPTSGWQADQRFPNVITWLQHTAIRDFAKDPGTLDQVKTQMRILYPDGQISRKKHLGDSIMTAIILAPFAESQIQFTDLGRLRVQECERVVALKSELTKCGAKVLETGDTLEVFPSQLHGAEIETYNDHRMAMCFAILGLKIPGIKIKNPACVKKTFPNFFQKLAEPPPHGLGTTIRDAATGRALGPAELFAQ